MQKNCFSSNNIATVALQEVRRHRVACVVRQAFTEPAEVLIILYLDRISTGAVFLPSTAKHGGRLFKH